jgi:hypothetical protein
MALAFWRGLVTAVRRPALALHERISEERFLSARVLDGAEGTSAASPGHCGAANRRDPKGHRPPPQAGLIQVGPNVVEFGD